MVPHATGANLVLLHSPPSTALGLFLLPGGRPRLFVADASTIQAGWGLAGDTAASVATANVNLERMAGSVEAFLRALVCISIRRVLINSMKAAIDQIGFVEAEQL